MGLSRANRNIAWIEENCRVPEGKFTGQKVKLRPWQKKEIRRLYDGKTRTFILSFGRKNGKTALAAFLLLLHLCGPEAQANSQLVSAAQTRDQAALVHGLAAKCARLSPDLEPFLIIRDTRKEMSCPDLGTLYRALSADASSNLGTSPVFAIHDELGEVRGARSDLYTAIEQGMSAHDEPLSLVISTQAPSDGDLLSILIDDAIEHEDPRTKISLYTSDAEADPFEEEQIRAANPAFGDFQNRNTVLKSRDDARRMPSMEAEYRNKVLNQRVSTDSPFVSKGVWAANGETLRAMSGQVFGGLDLAQRNDMSALVFLDENGGVEPHFWLPDENLDVRARTERVPYDVWAESGDLHVSPGTSIDYGAIADEIIRARDEYELASIAYDPNMAAALWPLLEDRGMTVEEREALFEKVPQSYAGMSPCIGELQALLLAENIKHGMHPVLTWNAANAVLIRGRVSDQFLLAKPKGADNQRIDGIVALAMAAGRRAMMMQDAEPRVTYVADSELLIL